MASTTTISTVLLLSVFVCFVNSEDPVPAHRCKCQNQADCNYVSTWDSATKEIIVTTMNKTDKEQYTRWMWDTISSVLMLKDNGANSELMCYAHSLGKKFGFMLDVPNDKNISKALNFSGVAAEDAELQRADILALNFMPLIGDCGNAGHHVDTIINVTKAVMSRVKSRNKNLRVLCVLPWQPPCYSSNCGITPVMATHCDALILNVDSFDTYCDEACIAKALTPYTKIMLSIQEYSAMGFNASQIMLSVGWHGYKYECNKTDVIKGPNTKYICHLNKTKVEGGPDKCLYKESRTRVDISTLFAEHPHLAYEETTYSRADQALYYPIQENNKTYLVWFEGVGSLKAKYLLVNDYHLKGMVVYTAEDLTYGTMPAKDKFNTVMWNWLLHTILTSASSTSGQEEPKSWAGTIAGIGVGMFLFGCLMGALIACVIFRQKRRLHSPFHHDKMDDEYRDDDNAL